jgi:hypothetical protein
MKLSLGCGRNQLTLPPYETDEDDWFSVDIRPQMNPHIVADFTKLDQYFLPDSVDEIYSCHSLEHIERDSVVSTLLQWHSILKPEGKLIVRVPNFVKHTNDWVSLPSDQQIFSTLNVIFGPGHGPQNHRNGFTCYSLSRYGELAGFETVSSTPFESRYGGEDGDLLYVGKKVQRSKDNLQQWIPLCAWSPQPFYSNIDILEEHTLTSTYNLQKKKIGDSVYLYPEDGWVYCRRGNDGELLCAKEYSKQQMARYKNRIHQLMQSDLHALVIVGNAIHAVPALLQSEIIRKKVAIFLLEPDIDALTAVLACYDLSRIPNDGRWQFFPVPIEPNSILQIVKLTGLFQMKYTCIIDPRLPNSRDIERCFNQAINQLRQTIQKQFQSLRTTPSERTILFHIVRGDRISKQIATSLISDSTSILERTSSLLETHAFGQTYQPFIPMNAFTLLHTISEQAAYVLWAINTIPQSNFPQISAGKLDFTIIEMQIDLLKSIHPNYPESIHIVSEQTLVPLLHRFEKQQVYYSPLANDIPYHELVKNKQNRIVFCQPPAAYTMQEKSDVFQQIHCDSSLWKRMNTIVSDIVDEETSELFTLLMNEFDDFDPEILCQIIRYVIRESTFLKQLEILNRISHLPVYLLNGKWADFLPIHNPLIRNIVSYSSDSMIYDFIARSQVALNIHSFGRVTGPNSWFFRYSACGVLQVTDQNKSFVEMNPHGEFFDSTDECYEKICTILEQPDFCNEMAVQSQQHTKTHHEYSHRMQYLCKLIPLLQT